MITQPDVQYRHSELARSTARSVASAKDSALYARKRAGLEQLVRDMGADPSACTSMQDLIAYAREWAGVVLEETREDVNRAVSDPAYQRRAFFDMAREKLARAEKTYADALAKVADNPARFDDHQLMDLAGASATVRVMRELLRWEVAKYPEEDVDPKRAGQPVSLEDIKDEVTKQVVRGAARGTSRSTNPGLNLLEEIELSVWAEVVDVLLGVL